MVPTNYDKTTPKIVNIKQKYVSHFKIIFIANMVKDVISYILPKYSIEQYKLRIIIISYINIQRLL